MTWTVPRMWVGQTVAILASGASMTVDVAGTVRAAGVAAIAVNTTYQRAPWADMLYAADKKWWEFHPQVFDEFAGLKVSVSDVPGVLRLRHSGMSGFDPDPSRIRLGGNSAFQAAHIAVHTGAARILLVGVDMGGEHWHTVHEKLRVTPQHAYDRWAGLFEELAHIVTALGVDVVNCSPVSKLRGIRYQPLDEALNT